VDFLFYIRLGDNYRGAVTVNSPFFAFPPHSLSQKSLTLNQKYANLRKIKGFEEE
jgi:hypothetical protein